MNFLYKKRDRKVIKDCVITSEDISEAKTVLFTVFGRYGDSIIGFVGIFLTQYLQYKGKN